MTFVTCCSVCCYVFVTDVIVILLLHKYIAATCSHGAMTYCSKLNYIVNMCSGLPLPPYYDPLFHQNMKKKLIYPIVFLVHCLNTV